MIPDLLPITISPHLTSVPLPSAFELAPNNSIFEASPETFSTDIKKIKAEEEEYEDENEPVEEEEPAQRAAVKVARRAAPVSTNLVAKDAFVASTVIPSISTPALSTLTQDSGLRMLVLGVPLNGAKSRVETQIKISLALVRSLNGEEFEDEDVMTPDGGLDTTAGQGMERIGTWSHVKLPQFLALKKKKAKKAPKPGGSFLKLSIERNETD